MHCIGFAPTTVGTERGPILVHNKILNKFVPIRAERKNPRSNQARNAGERFHKKYAKQNFYKSASH
jgi:hypothetical protein